ncbi:porin [Burkholderia multivorans]|uniref:porin n=1 Tax=Burkholderia multivorans TaxID=87883 RepID=UPI002018ABD3|nr:porin [Burkholderia multivorans]MCO1382813.1 porin [Burkholderia multivorans]MCO1403205.1 porin [Burkholderia multivorans]UQO78289.1 porin [Burkholderia multivorans]
MKSKSALAVALGLVSSVAAAQSSVTLFGTIDEGLNFVNNVGGGRSYATATSELATSRWGIKGSEDLGGGLHALFDLESAFDINNGSAFYHGRLFGYQSYIGIQDDRYGTVTLGRQFDSVVDVISPLTANGNWAGWLFTHPLDNDNTDGSQHISNAIKYTSPTINGFSGTAAYGFSNQAGGFSQNRFYSVALSYAYQTFSAGLAYADLSHPGTTSNGSVANDDMGFASDNQKTYAAGVNYGIGPVILGAVYTHVAVQNPTSSIYVTDLGLNGANVNFDNAEVNARYNVTPSFLLGAMYTYTRAKVKRSDGDSTVHWNQAGIMAQYLLSKRTSIYSQYVYQRVSGGTTQSALDTAFIPGTAGAASGQSQMVVRLGINHQF